MKNNCLLTWVHSDVYSELRIDHNVGAFKDGALLTTLHGALELDDLLRDHTQHLDVNAVELVEARPGTRTGQSFEELAHGHVV